MIYGRGGYLPSLEDKIPPNGSMCPHCGHERIYRHGKTSAGTMRYKCLKPKCHKTFSCGGKRKWVYTDVMKSNMILYLQLGSYGGIRATARGCGLSPNTLYRWLPKYYSEHLPWPTIYRPLFRHEKRPGEI